MKPITSMCSILPIQRIEFERRVSRVTWILRFQHFVMCVCVFAFLVGSDPDIVFKMIISGDGDQTGKEDMTVIQEMITTLQVNCSINHGHCAPIHFAFFQSVKVGSHGMERRACMTQLIRMARYYPTQKLSLSSSTKLFRSGTTGGLNEHFRTVLRVLLENLEDSEGR